MFHFELPLFFLSSGGMAGSVHVRICTNQQGGILSFFPWMDIEATELGGPDPENAVGSLDDNTDSSWPFPDVRGGLWDYSPSV